MDLEESKRRYKATNGYYQKECAKHSIDPQAFDLIGNIDWSLSDSERNSQIDEYIEKIVPLPLRIRPADIEELKRYESEIQEHIMEQMRENNKQYFESLLAEEDKIIDKIDAPIHNAISKMVETKIPFIVIEGRQGTGKSRAVDKALAKEGITDKAKTYTTRVSQPILYRIGYDNREDENFIILRDINIFRKDVIDMMKALTDTNEPRTIHKNCYSKENSDLPEKYEFKGKIILEVNIIPTEPADLKKDIDALMSRATYIPFHLSQQEIKLKMDAIAKEDWQKEVTGLIKSMPEADLNLRTQWHAFKTYEWAQKKHLDWKPLVEREIRRISLPKDHWKIYSYIGDNWVPRSQLIKALVVYDNKSVRTAYRRVEEWVKGEILHEHKSYVGLPKLEGI